MADSEDKIEEKDFIQEGYKKNPFPFWFWLFMIAVIAALLWGSKSWFVRNVEERVESTAFLQVTNRDMSIFLWEFPEHMRANTGRKTGYLPAFEYLDRETVEPDLADQIVQAPPELLFLYHTWHRLLGKIYFPTPISPTEFREFLNYDEQWKPIFWPKASDSYVRFVKSVLDGQVNDIDLQVMPESDLPLVVRKAFQGWQDYFKFGDRINKSTPSNEEIQKFIREYPNYARNYWRNILIGTKPNYLKTLNDKVTLEAPVPTQELAPFLKVAFFNYQQAFNKQSSFLLIGPKK